LPCRFSLAFPPPICLPAIHKLFCH
jgi:hypothetical protein